MKKYEFFRMLMASVENHTFSDSPAGRITLGAAHLGRIRPLMGAGGYTGRGEAGVSAKNSDKIKKA